MGRHASVLTGPDLEFPANGFLNDAEQIPGGIAYLAVTATRVPFLQNRLSLIAIDLPQRDSGAGLLFFFQCQKTLRHLQTVFSRARYGTYFFNTST